MIGLLASLRDRGLVLACYFCVMIDSKLRGGGLHHVGPYAAAAHGILEVPGVHVLGEPRNWRGDYKSALCSLPSPGYLKTREVEKSATTKTTKSV